MFKFSYISHLILIIFVPLWATGQSIQSPIEGIMATGKQIAQVRFMLEVYSSIGAGIKYQTPKKKLKNAINAYEETVESLQKNMNDPAIQTAVQKSLSAWPPVKKALLTALEERDSNAMKKEALFVHENIRTVIKEMEVMKDLFLKKANTPKVREINAGIEIAASARRLSSHYMLKMWEVPDPTIQKHWDNGMTKYHTAITTLQKSPAINDPKIAVWLKTCAKEYGFFQTVIGFDRYVPVLVQRHAQKAYEAAGKIVMKLLGHTDTP